MNYCMFEGNLVDSVSLKKSKDGSNYCFGKIGCYNGKDKDGEVNPSMFIEFVAYRKDAELIAEKANKGSRLLIYGTLTREDTKDEEGKKYVNLKVSCNMARILIKADAVKREEPEENAEEEEQSW